MPANQPIEHFVPSHLEIFPIQRSIMHTTRGSIDHHPLIEIVQRSGNDLTEFIHACIRRE